MRSLSTGSLPYLECLTMTSENNSSSDSLIKIILTQNLSISSPALGHRSLIEQPIFGDCLIPSLHLHCYLEGINRQAHPSPQRSLFLSLAPSGSAPEALSYHPHRIICLPDCAQSVFPVTCTTLVRQPVRTVIPPMPDPYSPGKGNSMRIPCKPHTRSSPGSNLLVRIKAISPSPLANARDSAVMNTISTLELPAIFSPGAP